MVTVILAGALAVSALQQQVTDTTFDVRAGGGLSVEALNGSVRIGTWDRSEMRVRAQHGSGVRIEVARRTASVSIEAEHHSGPANVQFEITVPRNYNIEIEGVNLPVTVEGVQGNITLENVEGALIVRSIVGNVDVESVGGSITVENVRGNVSASSVNESLRLVGVRGHIDAEAVNGTIVMSDIDAARVAASTINGLIEYSGTVHDNGIYNLSTHNGRIVMALPENANATVYVETFNGKVDTAFPVRVRTVDEREFTITLGSGSARVELESHNGTISLVRPRR